MQKVAAYKLQLPSSLSIHSVLHVWRLKPNHPSTVFAAQQNLLPSILLEELLSFWVLRLQTGKMLGNTSTQWLVEWCGSVAWSPTWEDASQHQHHFPTFTPWGQGGCQGKAVVGRELLYVKKPIVQGNYNIIGSGQMRRLAYFSTIIKAVSHCNYCIKKLEMKVAL